jgi:hypothetical protein
VSASADIGTLSYAEQLSLPGYSYADHLALSPQQEQCDFVRPSRTQVAEYLRAYPQAVGISDAVFTGHQVDGVYRTKDGFAIPSLGIRCKHLVLASGIFTVNIPPPLLLAPISQLHSDDDPLLVIGSGFSAADVIISTPTNRKVLHIFQWSPESRSSPLRGCHHSAYPEYATVYRQMKLAAIASFKANTARSPMTRRKSNPFFSKRDWGTAYEGLPNASILSVDQEKGANAATVTIRLASGTTITRKVGGLQYVVGRRGTLDFLSPDLRAEVLGIPTDSIESTLISGHTLRTKSETSLEVAKNVFIIGSLAGDSLIRHAIGGCVFAAGRILGVLPPTPSSKFPSPTSSSTSTPRSTSPTHSSTPSPPTPASTSTSNSLAVTTNGHSDLHLDRRNLVKEVEKASAVNTIWKDSGWWAGGVGRGSGG